MAEERLFSVEARRDVVPDLDLAVTAALTLVSGARGQAACHIGRTQCATAARPPRRLRIWPSRSNGFRRCDQFHAYGPTAGSTAAVRGHEPAHVVRFGPLSTSDAARGYQTDAGDSAMHRSPARCIGLRGPQLAGRLRTLRRRARRARSSVANRQG